MNSREGFTLVELIVSIALAGLFVSSLVVGYGYLSSQKEDMRRYTVASSIAQSNLNKYVHGVEVVCSAATTSSESVILDNDSPLREDVPQGGFVNFDQRVTVQYLHGCSQLPTVKSVASYGPSESRREIVLVDYAR